MHEERRWVRQAKILAPPQKSAHRLASNLARRTTPLRWA